MNTPKFAKKMPLKNKKYDRILITLLGKNEHVGDNIMKSGVIELIRDNFPKSRITVCAKFPDVYRRNPFVDAVIDGSKLNIAGRFDVILDLNSYSDAFFKGPEIIEISHQVFRGELRKMFAVSPPPFTCGDIPLVFSKTDEFTLALKVIGLTVKHRYFPRLFCCSKAYEKIVGKLKDREFNFSKPVYILCESASDPSREWGVENFTKLAGLITGRGAQVIVSASDKGEAESLSPYIRAGADKKLLFSLKTTFEEYTALLGLNNYFLRNLISGIVAGDTGALHAAQAANNILPEFLRPGVICLGHDRITGDIRYSDPGTVYITRIKPRRNKSLETAAEAKMKLFNKKSLLKLTGLPCRFISIDEPVESDYLVRKIPYEPKVFPVFFGKQIYGHTLLRNILKNENSSLTDFFRKKFYIRADVKKIAPRKVFALLEDLEFQKSETAKTASSRFGFLKTSRGIPERRKLETAFLSENFCIEKKGIMVPRPVYFSRSAGGEEVFLNSLISGIPLLGLWKKLESGQKMKILRQVFGQLKKVHGIKFNNFGKFGAVSSAMFPSWGEYLKFCVCRRLKEIERRHLLPKNEILRIKEFVLKNLKFLNSRGSFLIHHDMKIDNIMVENGKLSGLIDWEYSTAGPVDYEADTLFRSFEEPEIYFGKKGRFLKTDGGLVKMAAMRYYPELLAARYAEQRFRFYNLKFYLDLLAMAKHVKFCRLSIRGIVNSCP